AALPCTVTVAPGCHSQDRLTANLTVAVGNLGIGPGGAVCVVLADKGFSSVNHSAMAFDFGLVVTHCPAPPLPNRQFPMWQVPHWRSPGDLRHWLRKSGLSVLRMPVLDLGR